MNRLILIGNGFDLAHGMKTGYTDFIFWYLKKVIESFYSNKYRKFDDGLMVVKSRYLEDNPNVGYPTNSLKFENIEDIDECLVMLNKIPSHIVDKMYEDLKDEVKIDRINEYKYFLDSLNINTETSDFLSQILNVHKAYNWVDIEQEYYNTLIEILKKQENEILYSRSQCESDIKKLHREFDLIIQLLNQYLKGLPSPPIIGKISQQLCEVTGKITLDNNATTIFPESIHFLNFNYTNWLFKYTDDFPSQFKNKAYINNIHGEVNNLKNPIIFGFGDETDQNYSKLENTNMNIMLKYAKSFGYFKTSNYQRLTKFIDSKEFEIYVMGHSCGLSDRTMLKMIFEHSNCKSIKIFYYQKGDWNNYFELTQEISRHFSNKDSMRRKIVPFEHSIPLPQWHD